MKTYNVKLLTQRGIIERIISEDEVEKVTAEINATHGNFTTISSEEIGINLFEDYENIPAELQAILDEHEEGMIDGNYTELAEALKKCEAIGYTFEYYLDGEAYDLRKIGQKGKVELWNELELNS